MALRPDSASSFIRTLPLDVPVKEVIDRGWKERKLKIASGTVSSVRHKMKAAAAAAGAPEAARNGSGDTKPKPNGKTTAGLLLGASANSPALEHEAMALMMRLGLDRSRSLLAKLEHMLDH